MENPRDNRLRAERKKRNLSQEQVARQLGIDRTAYLRIENGTRLPRVDRALGIAAFFGRTVEELFGPGKDYIHPEVDVAEKGVGR